MKVSTANVKIEQQAVFHKQFSITNSFLSQKDYLITPTFKAKGHGDAKLLNEPNPIKREINC